MNEDLLKIIDLIIKYPNDMDLGKHVRSLFIDNVLKEKDPRLDNYIAGDERD